MARSKATVRTFAWDGDIAAVVSAWAAERGFEAGLSDDGVLRYWGMPQGTREVPMAVLCVTAAAREGQVELRFWIVSGSAVRLATLFAVPSSMGIESGGFVGFVYRRRTRVAANDLLGRFGQPPIS